jgi:hypothetical protein
MKIGSFFSFLFFLGGGFKSLASFSQKSSNFFSKIYRRKTDFSQKKNGMVSLGQFFGKKKFLCRILTAPFFFWGCPKWRKFAQKNAAHYL